MIKSYLEYQAHALFHLVMPVLFLLLLHVEYANAQLVINEGSNKNYMGIADENGDYPDWIELYNAGPDTVFLLNYSLSDQESIPGKWIFPNVKLAPGAYKVVFCSDKNRKPVSGFKNVVNTGPFHASFGWNTHIFFAPFYWDGISNILINTCSYSSTGYTVNSVFNQTPTDHFSCAFTFADGSPWACSSAYGGTVKLRPNIRLNNTVIGTGTNQNSPYDYPAPYGNWYWGARHQLLYLASELIDSGLAPGNIDSLAFDVAWTDTNTWYDYVDIHLKLIESEGLTSTYEPVDTNNFLHTNFKLSSAGEMVYLFSPQGELISSLFVSCDDLDNSSGLYPDASPGNYVFQYATPGSSNNGSMPFNNYYLPPVFTTNPGIFTQPVQVGMINPNGNTSYIRYTMDGSDPTASSFIYNGNPVYISSSTPLKARVFGTDAVPSPIISGSYLFNINHTTPVLSLVTDNSNLYGEHGIFDHWDYDWERAAHVDYFDSLQNLIFSQKAGIQIDGGAGGSRSHPQHSFRVEMDDGVLGAGSVYYPIIPGRPERLKYGKLYLRNGSNQYLGFPHKDACELEVVSGQTKNYYSAMRPVSVYINGGYFGLYELREKLDAEYFDVYDNADPDSLDILSLSYWYGGALRAVEGSTAPFYSAYEQFVSLDPADTSYWSQADPFFDLEWYTDYIIAESWIANTDWPWNNIKIYRSDATGFRWRFATIDLEWGLHPNGWTDCYFDHIDYLLNSDPGIPYVNIWKRSIQNEKFRHYFINRFADVMNTSYLPERTSAIENTFYNLMLPEMPNEYARWGDPGNINGQMENFYNNHLTITEQYSIRSGEVRNHIQTRFSLPNQVDLTLDVHPAGAGKIHISTITPDNYPWQGVYFNGIPVRMEVIENPGYDFSHWGDNGLIADPDNPVFYGVLDATEVIFEAFFDPGTTGIRTANEDLQAFLIYPQPAKDQLNILLNVPAESAVIRYTITDLNGAVIQEGGLPPQGEVRCVNLSVLPPSIYILKLYDQHGFIGQNRFVKMF